MISSIPVYQMQVLYFPSGVCNDIDRLTRNFIWNGRAGTRYCSLVSWNKVTTPKRHGGLGIRDAHCTNLAHLGKLVWSLLHDDHKVWTAMLKHKYFRNSRVLDGSHVGHQSYICQSIIKTITALRDGFHWSMGKGDASVWYDNWLGSARLCEMVPFIHIHDTCLRLKDIRRNGNWTWNILWSSLPFEVYEIIDAVTICDDLHDVDGWFWEDSNSKIYTTAAGYDWLLNKKLGWDTSKNWAWIWRLKTQEKVKVLIWLSAQEALPNNMVRCSRGLSISPLCTRCTSAMESTMHCLRDCPVVLPVWDHLGFTVGHGF